MDELSSIELAEPSGLGAIGLYLDIISAVFSVLEQGLRVLIMVAVSRCASLTVTAASQARGAKKPG